ncbi:HEAT repeat domain-containing protein, partial [Planctomycetota bacterium]
ALRAKSGFKAVRVDFSTAEVATARSIPVFSLLAAVAVVAICLGWYLFNSMFNAKYIESDKARAVSRISAKDRFYVLRTELEQQSMMAQGFDDFTVKHCIIGAEIAGFTLADIEEGAFSLRHADGRIVCMEIGQWNQESLSKLNGEVLALKQLHQVGQMTDEDLQRLGAIARYGDLTALRVLKRIATAAGDHYCKLAKQMLEGANPEALSMLIKMARDKKHKYRQHILQELAALRAIQGLIVLREIAADQQDSCQVFAIRTLAGSGDREALPLLERLCRDPALPKATRGAAREAFDKLAKLK